MRTLKFRVWNNKESKWIHCPHKYSSLDGCNILGEMILFGEFLNGVSIKDLNHIVVFQYTGIDDSLDVGIFEGDVIENQAGKRYVVTYVRMGFEFRLLTNENEPTDIYCQYIGDNANLRVVDKVVENEKLREILIKIED